MIRLLFFGSAGNFPRSRRRLLANAGIQLIRAENGSDAERLLVARRIDVLMIDDRAAVNERNRLALLAKSRQTRIIFLYCGSISKAESADALLTVEVSTEDLISTIRRLADRVIEGVGLSRSVG
jgi:response regulator RpfG family c-di-GMP phosphodiesterase